MNNTIKKSFFQSSFFTFFNIVLSLIPLSFIYGSFSSLLTFLQSSHNLWISINPIIGFISFIISKIMLKKVLSFSMFILSAPSFISGFIFFFINKYNKTIPFKLINIFLYFFFTIFFIYLRPDCYLYTVLWIPLLINIFFNSSFFRIFSMQLYAHATGTILHVFLFPPLTPSEYMILIPIALLERLILSFVGYTLMKLYTYSYAYFFLKKKLHAK